MMPDAAVLIVGGGPAGVAAAVALAERGIAVLLVEQRDRLGGAIHRQPANTQINHAVHTARHAKAWKALAARFDNAGDRIATRFSTVFLGSDDQGNVLLDDRTDGRVLVVRPRALLLAVGAVEHIEPFEGWHLPGVMSAGGAQLMLKETGRFAPGRTLVAGSGPLPVACAAQLAAIGAAPVALVQKAKPWRSPAAALQLFASPAIAGEALSYAAALLAARVSQLAGAEIKRVRSISSGLTVEVRTDNGRVREYTVDNLVISDGLRSNQTGLPRAHESGSRPILHAGDCREILGADAAIEDGVFAARRIAAILSRSADMPQSPRALVKARSIQALLRKLTMVVPRPLSEHTILCRCEGMRVSDLSALGPGRSAYETRLVGRFGLGPCQGRFCRANVAQFSGLSADELERRETQNPRWPLRPVSIAALCAVRALGNSEPSGEEA